jgi:ketosteroid isomerase-like protein
MRWLAVPILLAALFTCAPGQIKVKDKGSAKVAADKSKPVRRGIEDWYARNNEGFREKDLAALMGLRTEDFHTVTPDGKANDRAFMEQRTRNFLAAIERWISLKFEIGTIEVDGNLASAYVTQDTVRMQRLPDGTIHKVQAKAIQRETFRLTPEGWKLHKVDDIKDLGLYVDGKRVERKGG